MALHANPHIKNLCPVEHGGTGYAGLKDALGIMDFSTCCNPYGPPSGLRLALRNADIETYPDTRSKHLVKALAKNLGAAPENVIAGSGSTEIIRLAALAYLAAGDKVIVPSPTYGEYELAGRIAGAEIIKYHLLEDRDFQMDADGFAEFTRGHNPKAVFLCNPNNPTGQLLPGEDVHRLVKGLPDTLVILDEAYLAFTQASSGAAALISRPNVLVVRSMTKDFALAGLRLGYGLACREIIDNLEKVRPPWNVSSPAQQAGIAAVGLDGYMRQSNAGIQKCSAYLARRLASLGYKIISSDTHFFLMRVGNAADFKSRLLDKGFLVRDCSSFGLPAYVRISPRRMGDCQKLVQAISMMAGKAG